MQYTLYDNKIVITNSPDFSVHDTLVCGQVFRFEIISPQKYLVFTGSHSATVEVGEQTTTIWGDPTVFENYFDLKTNYAAIKAKLFKHKELQQPILQGGGIRILRQDPIETVLSFIISANNNIPRIQKSLAYICQHLGTNMGSYFAFPTLAQLASASQEFFKQAGLGYRAPQFVQAVQMLLTNQKMLNGNIDTQALKKQLMLLPGVGPKVADCALLFGFYKTDVFPTDTWILQACNGSNALTVANIQSARYGVLSGYAQQYLYHYHRNVKKPPKQAKQKQGATKA